ncbi:MAG: 50S ribosomal protein L4 [Clostridia bacterium]|nr:50S ribosomal protein L4 [Clostridia bacterium]
MPRVAVYSSSGEQMDEIELNERVFGAEINEGAMHEVALSQMANSRRGTAATKTRSEVRGGGRKPWRQKGTGRARAGSIRSPIWRGGGVVFGPSPRSFRYRLPQKIRNLALRSALSAKLAGGNLIVLDELNFDEPKTRKMADVLRVLEVDGKAVVATEKGNLNVMKSARNIPGVLPRPVDKLSVLDLLTHKQLLLTKGAVLHLEEVLG